MLPDFEGTEEKLTQRRKQSINVVNLIHFQLMEYDMKYLHWLFDSDSRQSVVTLCF